MEVEQASVIFPGRHELAGFCVVGARAKAKVLFQVVPAADIVSGENIEAPHAAQERVFCGPTANAPNGEQFFERVAVVELMEGLEIQIAGSDRAAEFKNGAFFIVTVAEGAKCAGRDAGEILGQRTSVRGGIGRSGAAEIFNQAIQEHHADVQGNLLARNGVEESFEDGGIAGRLETGERGGERAQGFLFCGEGIERAEIDGQAEHAFESGANEGLKRGSRTRTVCGDAEARMRGVRDLLDGEFDDLIACACGERKSAAVGLAVPAVENILGAAAQCPDGEVEAEGRDRTQREGKGGSCGGALGWRRLRGDRREIS